MEGQILGFLTLGVFYSFPLAALVLVPPLLFHSQTSRPFLCFTGKESANEWSRTSEKERSARARNFLRSKDKKNLSLHLCASFFHTRFLLLAVFVFCLARDIRLFVLLTGILSTSCCFSVYALAHTERQNRSMEAAVRDSVDLSTLLHTMTPSDLHSSRRQLAVSFFFRSSSNGLGTTRPINWHWWGGERAETGKEGGQLSQLISIPCSLAETHSSANRWQIEWEIAEHEKWLQAANGLLIEPSFFNDSWLPFSGYHSCAHNSLILEWSTILLSKSVPQLLPTYILKCSTTLDLTLCIF